MNIKQEINSDANPEDVPILHWLFERYHMASQWRFVARCDWQRYGTLSYEMKRIWKPTAEGYALYRYAMLTKI